jgi:RNA polymerase sigma-70 factor (ECF subfamily)
MRSTDNLQLNDPEVFGQFYETAHLAVFRYIYALHGGPRQEVEDLTTETFIKAWNARKRFKGPQRGAVSWVMLIARRLVIDSFRRQKVRGYQIDIEASELLSSEPLPEEHTAQQEQMTTLMNLLGELPVEKRELLILRYVLGWRVKDIGAHLGLQENTVSVQIKRSLEKLRQDWPLGEDED